MRTILAALALVLGLSGMGRADDRLHDLIATERLFAVLAQEYVAMAQSMQQAEPGMLGEDWLRAMTALYDARAMEALYRQALDARLAARPDVTDEIVTFAQSDLGREIIAREIETRAAMLDPDWTPVAPPAKDAELLLATVASVIEGFDLVEGNVASALNAHLDDARGFFEALEMPFDTPEMVTALYASEPELRETTEGWLRDFLITAYAGLSPEALDLLARQSRDPLHRAFVRAQMAAFEAAFEGRAHEAGVLRGLALRSSSL
jgi:hypothetical protein